MGRRILLALGGNAILPHGKSGKIEEQREITLHTMRTLLDGLAPEDKVVITHGNGPVVGNILIRNAAAADRIPPMPLDVCGADSQGGIGYMIVQCVDLAQVGAPAPRPVTALVTRVRVDEKDPAFRKPSKPIGPFYAQADAERQATEYGWTVVEDAGRGWRRVVASPQPVEIVELESIRALFEAGQLVVAAGGGGVPVRVDTEGREHGVEAVIDKDRASALLAAELGIESFVIVTQVSHVSVNFGKPDQRDLDVLPAADARAFMEAGEFGEGSMKPKIESALTFLEQGGKEVLITSPEELGRALQGESGTRIVP